MFKMSSTEIQGYEGVPMSKEQNQNLILVETTCSQTFLIYVS